MSGKINDRKRSVPTVTLFFDERFKKKSMKRYFLILLTLVLGMGLRAQTEKNLVIDADAEARPVGAFKGIEVSGAIDLYLSQGTENAVAISANNLEIRDRIRTEVRDGILHIYFDGKGLNWKRWINHRMKGYITFKNLERLEATGACNVRAPQIIRQDTLSIEMSGASDFQGEVAIGGLLLRASGASNFKISGKADRASIEASGACNVKGYDLSTDFCRIDASGASNVRITVNKELNAVASGGSDIFYRGTGLIRDISSSGGATVKRRDND
jgi:hypothetical protein